MRVWSSGGIAAGRVRGVEEALELDERVGELVALVDERRQPAAAERLAARRARALALAERVRVARHHQQLLQFI